MESAIFGLIGVALGALLTLLREWLLQSRKEKKERDLLAVQVSCVLDRFAADCSLVVSDEGRWERQPSGEECHFTSVDEPKIDFDSLKVEWKYLPADLMHRILRLPFEVHATSLIIENAFEVASTPPDFEYGWNRRRNLYAQLGICAMELATSLRRLAQLQDVSEPISLSIREHLQAAMADLERQNETFEENYNAPRTQSDA